MPCFIKSEGKKHFCGVREGKASLNSENKTFENDFDSHCFKVVILMEDVD